MAEKEAEEFNGLIMAINTDRGSQFYPNKRDKNGEADCEAKDGSLLRDLSTVQVT